jgi:hypothetical protein
VPCRAVPNLSITIRNFFIAVQLCALKLRWKLRRVTHGKRCVYPEPEPFRPPVSPPNKVTCELTERKRRRGGRCELRDNVALRCGGVIYNERRSRLHADRTHFASNRELDCRAGARLATASAPYPSPAG